MRTVLTLRDFIIPLIFFCSCIFFFYANVNDAMTVTMIVRRFFTTVQNYPTYVQNVRNVQSERNTEWTVLCHHAIDDDHVRRSISSRQLLLLVFSH